LISDCDLLIPVLLRFEFGGDSLVLGKGLGFHSLLAKKLSHLQSTRRISRIERGSLPQQIERLGLATFLVVTVGGGLERGDRLGLEPHSLIELGECDVCRIMLWIEVQDLFEDGHGTRIESILSILLRDLAVLGNGFFGLSPSTIGVADFEQELGIAWIRLQGLRARAWHRVDPPSGACCTPSEPWLSRLSAPACAQLPVLFVYSAPRAPQHGEMTKRRTRNDRCGSPSSICIGQQEPPLRCTWGGRETVEAGVPGGSSPHCSRLRPAMICRIRERAGPRGRGRVDEWMSGAGSPRGDSRTLAAQALHERFESKLVSLRPQAGNDTNRDRGNVGKLSE